MLLIVSTLVGCEVRRRLSMGMDRSAASLTVSPASRISLELNPLPTLHPPPVDLTRGVGRSSDVVGGETTVTVAVLLISSAPRTVRVSVYWSFQRGGRCTSHRFRPHQRLDLWRRGRRRRSGCSTPGLFPRRGQLSPVPR